MTQRVDVYADLPPGYSVVDTEAWAAMRDALETCREEVGDVEVTLDRLEAKLDALIKALKRHGVGAWQEKA